MTNRWGYPITPEESQHLKRLGAELKRLRGKNDATQAALGNLASLSPATISGIERGVFRTRRSTLRRISVALIGEEDAESLWERLCELAGPALAEESKYERTELRLLSRVVAQRRGLRDRVRQRRRADSTLLEVGDENDRRADAILASIEARLRSELSRY